MTTSSDDVRNLSRAALDALREVANIGAGHAATALSQITGQIARAIAHAAARVDGPIRLSGHSAGGHLVTRMVCADSPLEAGVRNRIEHTLSISGLHDLRPLLHTGMNDTLHLDLAEARAENGFTGAELGDFRLKLSNAVLIGRIDCHDRWIPKAPRCGNRATADRHVRISAQNGAISGPAQDRVSACLLQSARLR